MQLIKIENLRGGGSDFNEPIACRYWINPEHVVYIQQEPHESAYIQLVAGPKIELSPATWKLVEHHFAPNQSPEDRQAP